MRSGHSFWAKTRQASATIELGTLFNEYWGSTEHEFVVPGESCLPTSPRISDRKGQRSLSWESIFALLNSDFLQTVQSVSLYFCIQVN